MPPLTSCNTHTEGLGTDIPMFEIESHDMLTSDLMDCGEMPDSASQGEVIGQPAQLLLPGAIGQPLGRHNIGEISSHHVSGWCSLNPVVHL